MALEVSVRSHVAVSQAVRRWIALGTYGPGERLPSERDLAERFGIGRVTVRRAMRDLASEGLVSTTRGRGGGTTVLDGSRLQTPSLDHEELLRAVRDSFEFRLAIEPRAAALAATRASEAQRVELRDLLSASPASFWEYRSLDSRLHLCIARASDNALISSAVESSRTDFFAWADALRRHTDWADLDEREQDFAGHHTPVISAVLARDEELAEQAMREHLLLGRDQFTAIVHDAGFTLTASG